MAINLDIDFTVYIVGTLASWIVLTSVLKSGLIRRLLLSLIIMMAGTLSYLLIIDRYQIELSEFEFTIGILATQFIFSLILGYIFKARISNPMREVIRQSNRMADGDLTNQIDVTTRGVGETMTLIHSTTVLANRFTKIISDIKASSTELGQAAEELAAGSEEVSATTEEVTATVQTIAEGASEQVRRLDEVSSILTEMVNVTEESIRQVGITSRITLDLAEQTNLVSLNAAIEAAKAANQSEGFQVVADHVRQLSIESKTASNAVNQIAQQIAARMRDSVERIVSAVEKIASVAENTAASSEEAAAAAEEQSAALQEITQQAQRLADLSDKSERNVQEFQLS